MSSLFCIWRSTMSSMRRSSRNLTTVVGTEVDTSEEHDEFETTHDYPPAAYYPNVNA
jgi:hypothetical protein